MAREETNLGGHEKRSGRPEDIFISNPWMFSTATYITYSSDKEVVGFQFNASSDNMMLDGLPCLEVW